MGGSLCEALQSVGIYANEEKKFYNSMREIPGYMFIALLNKTVNESRRDGVRYASNFDETFVNTVNDLISSKLSKTGVSARFIRKLHILEDKKENLEVRKFLLKYRNKILLDKGFGLAISYDKCSLGFSVLQTPVDGMEEFSMERALNVLSIGINSGKIPFICLKINDFIGFSVKSMKLSKDNYLSSAYGINIIEDDVCNKHLSDWYNKFGKQAVSYWSVYHILRCNSTKHKDQWYLIKDKGEINDGEQSRNL